MNPVQRLLQVAQKPERLAVGLMSGMSMDGLDLALVRIRARPGGIGRDVSLLAAETVPYDAALVGRLRACVVGSTRDVCRLGFDLAEGWAADVLGFLRAAGVRPAEVDLLGSHGQTVAHDPRSEGRPAATLQIGQGDVLAERTGILTVSDFRPRDVAAGGEGAPLIPLADWLLFARAGEISACHNLGSIANVTVVTERREDVLAFDTGPANAVIDAYARRVPGAPGGIDRDGAVSARGRVLPEVLATLGDLTREFRSRLAPKSAGFDEIGPGLADRAASLHPEARAEDLVATAVEFTATTIRDAYARDVCPRHPRLAVVRFSGGGTRNATLMARLGTLLAPLGLRVEVLEDRWSKAKEAVGFALLADETVGGRPGNLPGATGARREAVLGKISLGP